MAEFMCAACEGPLDVSKCVERDSIAEYIQYSPHLHYSPCFTPSLLFYRWNIITTNSYLREDE